MQQITNSVYAESDYAIPTVGCIITDEGAVLVDSPFLPHEAQDWYAKVSRLTKKGIAYIINTDWHFDHILGDCFLGGKVIAHQRSFSGFQHYLNKQNLYSDIKSFFPRNFLAWEKELEQARVVLPQITFSDELELHLGNMHIQLKFVGGHSPGTIWIFIPEDKVLFTGDNMEPKRHPAMRGAKFDVWMDLLRKAKEMDIRWIVPGHGQVSDKSLVTSMLEYFELMQQKVRESKDRGASKEETSAKVADYMLLYSGCHNEEMDEDGLKWLVKTGVERMYDQLQ